MPGGQERALKRRIKGAQSTKKITRAMELISASRIAKAQAKVAAARPYAEQITEVIRNLSAAGAGTGQPLLTTPEQVRCVGVVVVTADRGLAGGYNSGAIKAAEAVIAAAEAAGQTAKVYVVGRKGVSYFRYRERALAGEFIGFTDNPAYEDARSIARAVVADFEAGEVDRVELAYTQFLSVGTQRPTTRRFIPLEPEALPGQAAAASGEGVMQADYEFEPDPTTILARILPRYVESRLYAALLDAAASEHAARQRAMKSATDNAGELIKRLERQMNRARQEAITTEIIEIASGAEALNNTGEDGGSNQSKDFFAERDANPFDRQNTHHHSH